MEEIARRAGWSIDAAPDANIWHDDVSEHRWKVDESSTITLVRSVALESPYLVVSGPNLGDLVAAISSLVPTYTVGDIVDRLSGADSADEKMEALQLLAAVGVRHHREDLHRILAANLRDRNARVRVAALHAAFQLNWKQLRPLLEATSDTDEDPDLRALSSNLLKLTDWSAG